jgi:hypothetical protein
LAGQWALGLRIRTKCRGAGRWRRLIGQREKPDHSDYSDMPIFSFGEKSPENRALRSIRTVRTFERMNSDNKIRSDIIWTNGSNHNNCLKTILSLSLPPIPPHVSVFRSVVTSSGKCPNGPNAPNSSDFRRFLFECFFDPVRIVRIGRLPAGFCSEWLHLGGKGMRRKRPSGGDRRL